VFGEAVGSRGWVDVVRAAGWKTNDAAHQPRRIGLRPGSPRDGGKRGSARGEMEKFPAGKFHGVPLRNAATLHSALMSAVRITLPHLSASSALNVPNPAHAMLLGA